MRIAGRLPALWKEEEERETERNDLSHLPSALITRLSVAAAAIEEEEEAFFIDTSRCAKRRNAADDR